MKTKSYKLLLFVVSFLFSLFLFNFAHSQEEQTCGMSGTSSPTTQVGGRYKPAEGTFKVIVLYVQFSDDNTDINNPNWPKGQPPAFMTGTVDETWSTTPTPGSMTDYFNQMSFNQLKIIGKEV